MKFVIAKSDFDDALKTVSPTLSGGDDVRSHFLFRCSEKEIEILSAGGTSFSMTPLVGVKVEEYGESFTVEGKRLRNWLSVVDEGQTITVTFDPETRYTTFSEKRGSQKFASLDPSLFPSWDKQLQDSKKTMVISAERLRNALDHAKDFVYADSDRAILNVAEFKSGELRSSNILCLSSVAVEGSEECTSRFYQKNIGPAIKFLSLFGDADVEILEHEMMSFIKTPEGALFGETGWSAKFPDISIPSQDPSDVWRVSRDEVRKAFAWLKAGAQKDDDRVILSRNGDVVNAEMVSLTGESIQYEIGCPEHTGDGSDLPEGGVPVPSDWLVKSMESSGDDMVSLEIIPIEPAGVIRVTTSRGPDKFQTFVGWKK